MHKRCCMILGATLRNRLSRCHHCYLSSVTATHTCSYCVAASHATTTTTVATLPKADTTTRTPLGKDIRKVVYDPKIDMSEAEVKHIKLDPNPQIIEPSDTLKYKYALLLSFNGQEFYGLQRNGTGNTIENRLLDALLSAGLITQEEHTVPQLFNLRRSSRTDKGVSACRLLVSGTLSETDTSAIKSKINAHITGPIRVMGVYKTIKSFSGKDWCESRSYSYTCPTFAFASYTEVVQDSYRLSKEGLEDIRSLFSVYKGTHNFHNFTAQIKPWDVRASRHISNIECTDPFEHSGLQWITINIKGRSFMLHQIRKMIGLVISVRRGLAGVDAIRAALTEDYAFLPIAPGLGLVLQDQHYDGYNKKYGREESRMPLCWESEREAIEEFYRKNILSPLMKKEIEERSMFNWLKTLPCSSFDMVKNTDKAGRDKKPKDSRTTPFPLTVAYRICYPSKTSEDSSGGGGGGGDDSDGETASASDLDEGERERMFP